MTAAARIGRLRNLLLPLAAPDWFSCEPGLKAQVAQTLFDCFEQILATDGPAAFEMPKSAACAHEAGHAVIGTILRDRIVRVEVWPDRKLARQLGLAAWGGQTHAARNGWRISPDTPAEQLAGRICRIEAGNVAETLLDPDGWRSGSSLDERVVAQFLANELHLRRGRPGHPQGTWRECWAWTAAAIKHNAAIARELAAKLDLMGSIQGKPLAAILQQVRPIEGGYA